MHLKPVCLHLTAFVISTNTVPFGDFTLSLDKILDFSRLDGKVDN